MRSPDWHVSMFDIHLRSLLWCTALEMPEWREMTEQRDWRARHGSQVACVSEYLVLRSLRHYPQASHQRRHGKGITSSPGSPRGEICRKRKRLTIFLERTRGPSSIRRTLELFQRQRFGQTSESRAWMHMGISRRIDPILNCTPSQPYRLYQADGENGGKGWQHKLYFTCARERATDRQTDRQTDRELCI